MILDNLSDFRAAGYTCDDVDDYLHDMFPPPIITNLERVCNLPARDMVDLRDAFLCLEIWFFSTHYPKFRVNGLVCRSVLDMFSHIRAFPRNLSGIRYDELHRELLYHRVLRRYLNCPAGTGMFEDDIGRRRK